MIDLISRQEAVDIVIEYVKKLCESIGTPEDNEMYSYGRGLLISIVLNLKHLPSAEPKKGKWVGASEYAKHLTEETGEVYTLSSMETDRLFCNQCWKPGGKLKTNYCPHCGAKMEVTE